MIIARLYIPLLFVGLSLTHFSSLLPSPAPTSSASLHLFSVIFLSSSVILSLHSSACLFIPQGACSKFNLIFFLLTSRRPSFLSFQSLLCPPPLPVDRAVLSCTAFLLLPRSSSNISPLSFFHPNFCIHPVIISSLLLLFSSRLSASFLCFSSPSSVTT